MIQKDKRSFTHIETWVFDLDNTLYPHHVNLWQQVDVRIRDFVAQYLNVPKDEAFKIQKDYYRRYGTTMRGMMTEHGLNADDFLAYVHDIEMDVLEQDAPLAAALAKLPGRKLVFTNGDKPYALKVLDRLGLGSHFEAVHDITAMGLVPKPQPSAYAGLCAAFDIDPTRAIFFEDMARNLVPAKAIGMTTVWVDNGSEQGPEAARDHIDYTVHALTPWLTSILED